MPNFRGVRFTNAHETLIWASTGKDATYTFNYHAMKGLNDDKQMRSDRWFASLATGAERVKDETGDKAHSTQRPDALLYRVILSSSNPSDVVLDPFFGSGTTGVVAKRLQRNWIGIEKEKRYAQIVQKRIDAVQLEMYDPTIFDVKSKSKPALKVAFSVLIEHGYLQPSQRLFFGKDNTKEAVIKPDSRLRTADGFEGSIHQAGSYYMHHVPCNGWEHWFVDVDGHMISLGEVREKFRVEKVLYNEQSG